MWQVHNVQQFVQLRVDFECRVCDNCNSYASRAAYDQSDEPSLSPTAKRARKDPKPGKKLTPSLPPKQAAGQDFLSRQLKEMSNSQAVLSAKTTQAANSRAIYKQKCAMYQSDKRLLEKKNDRKLQVYRIHSENAARTGGTAPLPPELDCTVLQEPELPACMRLETAADSPEGPVQNTQGSPGIEGSTPNPNFWDRSP